MEFPLSHFLVESFVIFLFPPIFIYAAHYWHTLMLCFLWEQHKWERVTLRCKRLKKLVLFLLKSFIFFFPNSMTLHFFPLSHIKSLRIRLLRRFPWSRFDFYFQLKITVFQKDVLFCSSSLEIFFSIFSIFFSHPVFLPPGLDTNSEQTGALIHFAFCLSLHTCLIRP